MIRYLAFRYLVEQHRLNSRPLNTNLWYQIDNDQLLLEELRGKFFQFHMDDETNEFLASCFDNSEMSWIKFIIILLFWPILRLFMYSTSLNGLFRCGLMFLFSEDQLKQFFRHNMQHIKTKRIDEQGFMLGNNLLDIGAGDGNITRKLSPFFQRTFVTEISRIMQKRLINRNYHNLDADNWFKINDPTTGQPIKFDMISYLNVLDRCDRPLEMLYRIRQSLLKSDGLLLMAVVLPFLQYVERKSSHQPDEIINISGDTFEEQVNSIHLNVIQPSGFELISWSKLPYFSESIYVSGYHVLIDAIFLLKPIPFDANAIQY